MYSVGVHKYGGPLLVKYFLLLFTIIYLVLSKLLCFYIESEIGYKVAHIQYSIELQVIS